MPCRINLISPPKRKYLQTMVRFQFIKNILEVILIVTCVIGIAMLGGQWLLANYFKSLNSTIASLRNQYAETNQTVISINQKLAQIEFIQNSYSPITPLLPNIIQAVPDDVSLTALNLNSKGKQLYMAGLAVNRDDLLELQAKLEAISWVETVNIPIDQLTKKDNINFSFSVVIK